jgi:hypothetical protein
MRESVARYFKTDDVSVGSGMKTERRVEYRYDELLLLAGCGKGDAAT